MSTDNSAILVGNLTDDPELRFTPNGAAVAKGNRAVALGRWRLRSWVTPGQTLRPAGRYWSTVSGGRSTW